MHFWFGKIDQLIGSRLFLWYCFNDFWLFFYTICWNNVFMLFPTNKYVVRWNITYNCNHYTIWRDLMMCVGCHQAKLCDFIQVRSTGQFRETRPALRPERRPTSVRSSYLSPISQIIFAEKNCYVEKFWDILEKFWDILGHFATIYAIHVEKNWAQKVHLWRKMTNMRSE